MNDPLPTRDRSQGEPRSIGSLDGTAKLHIDIDAFDFYIEVKPDHNPKTRCSLLTQADWWGLEVIPEDECPAEVQEDGSVRVYLTPKVPVNNVEAHMKALPKTVRLNNVYQRALVGVLGVGALVAANELVGSAQSMGLLG